MAWWQYNEQQYRCLIGFLLWGKAAKIAGNSGVVERTMYCIANPIIHEMILYFSLIRTRHRHTKCILLQPQFPLYSGNCGCNKMLLPALLPHLNIDSFSYIKETTCYYTCQKMSTKERSGQSGRNMKVGASGTKGKKSDAKCEFGIDI